MTLTSCRANPGEEKVFRFERTKTDALQDTCEKPVGRQDSERWEQVTKSLCTCSLKGQQNCTFPQLKKTCLRFLTLVGVYLPIVGVCLLLHICRRCERAFVERMLAVR